MSSLLEELDTETQSLSRELENIKAERKTITLEECRQVEANLIVAVSNWFASQNGHLDTIAFSIFSQAIGTI